MLCDVVSFGQPLHEVDFPLVLPGFGALAGSSFACERHVPALVLYVLESRVVILEHNLCEYAVLPLTIFLANQLSSSVHADVKSCLCSFNSDSTAECVCLHNQLCVYVSIISHGVDLFVGQDLDVFAAGSAVKLVGPY